jgi:hypothetical protein
MTPEQRKEMMERLRREVGEMTPEQRQQMMERFQRQGGGRGARGEGPAGQGRAPSGGADPMQRMPSPAPPTD